MIILRIFQKVPDPSTARTKILPDVLYCPVMRNSGMDSRSFIVIASGLALKRMSILKRILCVGISQHAERPV